MMPASCGRAEARARGRRFWVLDARIALHGEDSRYLMLASISREKIPDTKCPHLVEGQRLEAAGKKIPDT
jgi:hypothetical protein